MKFLELLIALGHAANAIFAIRMLGRAGAIWAYCTSFLMAVAILTIALAASLFVKGMA